MNPNCSYVFYLPATEGRYPQRMVVKNLGDGLVVAATEYLMYGCWRASIFSWPNSVGTGLVRLLSACSDTQHLKGSDYRHGLSVKRNIELQLENLTN